MGNISDVVASTKKEYKSDALITMGGEALRVPRIPTGLYGLDLATGGGIPRGCVTLIYGDEASAKTTTCLKAIATAQQTLPGKKAVFIDVEGHLDLNWAKKVGVNIKDLVVVRPNYAEQAVDLLEKLLYAEDCGIIILDSIAAMITTKEAEKSAEDVIVGNTGLVVNKMYRRVTLARNKVMKEGREPPTLIVINQIRYKVGMVFGSPETLPGGPSFKYAAFLILRLHGKDKVTKDTDEVYFKTISGVVKKDKIGCLSKSFEFDMCVTPIPAQGWSVGETDEWSVFSSFAQAFGLMAKKPSGKGQLVSSFKKDGEMLEFASEEAVKNHFLADAAFREKALPGLIAHVRKTKEEMGA